MNIASKSLITHCANARVPSDFGVLEDQHLVRSRCPSRFFLELSEVGSSLDSLSGLGSTFICFGGSSLDFAVASPDRCLIKKKEVEESAGLLDVCVCGCGNMIARGVV